MASILELQHHTGDCENPVNFIDVPRADDGAVQVGLFDQYDNIRSICLQTSEAGVELSTSLLSGSTRLPSTLSTVFRIDGTVQQSNNPLSVLIIFYWGDRSAVAGVLVSERGFLH